jgi:hypothetical protein
MENPHTGHARRPTQAGGRECPTHGVGMGDSRLTETYRDPSGRLSRTESLRRAVPSAWHATPECLISLEGCPYEGFSSDTGPRERGRGNEGGSTLLSRAGGGNLLWRGDLD